MVRHPAHHLEVCIHAPTVAGVPRRCHPVDGVITYVQFTKNYTVLKAFRRQGGTVGSAHSASGSTRVTERYLVVTRMFFSEVYPPNLT